MGRALGAGDGKGEDFVDGLGSGGDHEEAVEAEGAAGAGGKAVVHGGKQAAVVGQRVFAVGGAEGVVIAIAMAEDGGIEQFVIAVGQFDAADIELEAFGDRWIAGPNAGQGGLAGRIVVQDRWATLAEIRFDLRRE